MNDQGLTGALLPLWIIGAPLLAGIVMMFVTPKPVRRDQRDPVAMNPNAANPMRSRPAGYTDPIAPVSTVAPARF